MRGKGVNMRAMRAIINNERGTVLFVSILILLILTIIGLCSLGASTVEVKVSGQKKFYDVAFNAANGAIDYVIGLNPFGSMDWTNTMYNFDSTGISGVQFSGTVNYLGDTPPPVGSGTGLKVFKAHHYRIDSTGADATSVAQASIQTWGYRIGF